jgi:hypothetical protein
MVRWLCRWDTAAPQNWAAETDVARKLGIEAWLLPLCWDGVGQWQLDPFADWLIGQPGPPQRFCLEWTIHHPISPAEEIQAAEMLATWLASHAALREGERPVLVLANPQHLSHPLFGLRRLRGAIDLGLRRRGVRQVLLLLAGLGGQGLDGMLEKAERDYPCRLINSQFDYESFLYQAHQRKPSEGVRIAAVLPLLAEQDGVYCNGSAANYREWLDLVGSWVDVLHAGEQGDHWLLIESWRGHRRWFMTGESAAESSFTQTKLPPPLQTVETIGWGQPQPSHLALLVHGFYLDRLQLILERLPQGQNSNVDLYLSTPLEQLEEAAALVQRLGWQQVCLFGVENRGRDLAPFLNQLLPMAVANGHHTFVKLHTKFSPHLEDGDEWAEHLIDSLLGEEVLEAIEAQLEADPKLGLLAPAGTLMPMGLCLARNGKHLQGLLPQAGMKGCWFLDQQFIAGSMMAGRLGALLPLLALAPPLAMYEGEHGQTDGTLAHAMERLISGVPATVGYRLGELPGDSSRAPLFGHGWAAPGGLGLSCAQ